jgi:multidrug efflux system membrane fusion protein
MGCPPSPLSVDVMNLSRATASRSLSGVVLALTIVGTGCREAARGPAQAAPVTVAKVESRTVPVEVGAPGSVEPIQAVAVTAQVTGTLVRVLFREGDMVRQGQTLAEIDPRPYQNALRQAEATLARDVVQLENAQKQAERYRSLAQSEFVTPEQSDAIRTTADALAATVRSDSAALDNARLNLEYTNIRAPISGRTGTILIKEGNLIRAQSSGPLVEINQTNPILVRFAIPASHLGEVRARSTRDMVVRAGLGDSTVLTGRLAFVDNSVDTTTGTILLKARFDNTAGVLWPGQFVTATLVLYEEQGALVVPQPAVVDGESGPYVFVVGADEKAMVRPIKVGRAVGDLVIVTQGLDVGETVVVDGQLRIVPGEKVEVKGQ